LSVCCILQWRSSWNSLRIVSHSFRATKTRINLILALLFPSSTSSSALVSLNLLPPSHHLLQVWKLPYKTYR
jgi:hypothetical protein